MPRDIRPRYDALHWQWVTYHIVGELYARAGRAFDSGLATMRESVGSIPVEYGHFLRAVA